MKQTGKAVVISDLHIGGGAKAGFDAFRDDRLFEALVTKRIAPFRDFDILVLNGDFVDFARIYPDYGKHGLGPGVGVTAEASVAKLQQAANAHPIVFDSLDRFLKGGGRIILVPGNHDVDFFGRRFSKR